MKKRLVYIITVLMLSLGAATAFAAPPVIDRYYEEDNLTFPFDCGDFQVAQIGDLWITFKYFFNKDGELIKLTINYTLQRSVFFNASNPAIYLKANVDTGITTVIFEDGMPVEVRERGAMWHMVLPGGEKLFFIAGIGIFDFATDTYDHRGILQWLFDENGEFNAELTERMCEYFAG